MLKPPDTRPIVVAIENVERALHDDHCFASLSAIRADHRRKLDIAYKVFAAEKAVEEARASAANMGPASVDAYTDKSTTELMRELDKKKAVMTNP